MTGFRYIIFPEHIYIVSVDDEFGNTQKIEILGQDILKQINKWYLQITNNDVSCLYEQNAEKKSGQGCGCDCQEG